MMASTNQVFIHDQSNGVDVSQDFHSDSSSNRSRTSSSVSTAPSSTQIPISTEEKPPSSETELKQVICGYLRKAEEEAEANGRVASDLYLEIPSSVSLENERLRRSIENRYGKLRITWREESQVLVAKAMPSATHEFAITEFVYRLRQALGPNGEFVRNDGSESKSCSTPRL